MFHKRKSWLCLTGREIVHVAASDFKLPRTSFERSRWRGGLFACYAQHVMPQGGAFHRDSRFSLFFVSPAKSLDCRRKKIEFA
jgi:hypothetical protein